MSIKEYSKNDFNYINEINNDLNNSKNVFPLLNYSDNDIFACKKCKKTYIIDSKTDILEEITMKCTCGEQKLFGENGPEKDTSNNSFMNELEIEFNENNIENIENSKKCLKHKENFDFYCNKCEINIYKKCNDHNGHTIIEFDKEKMDLKYKISYINDLLGINSTENQKDINFDFNINDKFIISISTIINNYYKYPNYQIIQNIKKIYDILSNYIKIHPNEENNQIYIKKALNINSSLEFDEIIKNKNNLILIKNIRIISMNFYKLDVFNNIELDNLVELDLRRNNIEDISYLAKIKLINLKKLNLGMNQIGDDMINSIKEFKFQQLEYLNFYNNYFSDYEFFNSVDYNHFKNLTFLSVSSNKFNYDISQIKVNEIKYNFSSLEKICFNNGVFDDNSSILLTRFEFPNAKSIFLASNNLTNIDFIKEDNFKLPKLERLCLDFNNISDIKALTCLKDKSPFLKRIELKYNCIENIKDVEELNLILNINEINLTGNNIKFNEYCEQHYKIIKK